MPDPFALSCKSHQYPLVSCDKLELPGDDDRSSAEVSGGDEKWNAPAPDGGTDDRGTDGLEPESGVNDGKLGMDYIESSLGYDGEEIQDWPEIAAPNGHFHTVCDAIDQSQEGVYGHPMRVRGYIVGYVAGSRLS